MFSKDIGIDLGTANTLVYMKGKGIVMREPSVVAVDVRTDTVLAVGSHAKDMIGRTPGSIVAVRPLKDGVIADFDITATMLKHFIKKAVKSTAFSRPHIVVCIPSGVTEVERRAVRQAAAKAGAARPRARERVSSRESSFFVPFMRFPPFHFEIRLLWAPIILAERSGSYKSCWKNFVFVSEKLV